MAFLVYCFLAVLWSDFPIIAFKRWIKNSWPPDHGPNSFHRAGSRGGASIRLMKRCAYVIVPVSILFIKYYPEWGRSLDEWTGAAMNNGVAVGKNMLGADCLILGLFFLWHWLETWRTERSKARRNELLLTGGLIYLIWWLLSMSHSSTSLMCSVIGASIMLFLGRRFVNKNFIGTYLLGAITIYALAEITFGISGYLITALGRDATLTGRTELWQQLFGFHTNPIFGVGFESFWLGDRTRKFEERCTGGVRTKLTTAIWKLT